MLICSMYNNTQNTYVTYYFVYINTQNNNNYICTFVCKKINKVFFQGNITNHPSHFKIFFPAPILLSSYHKIKIVVCY